MPAHEIDCPDRLCNGSCLDALTRPTNVSHPSILKLTNAMHDDGRDELVHYAGASYRDEHAWHVCLQWLADPSAPESELKARASKGTPLEVTAADIRAANPGMR